MNLVSLGSGSRGNATLLEAGQTRLLVDCGFSLKEFERRAALHQLDPSTISAILLTHEHSDHASGVAALARRYRVPVYLTHGSFASGRLAGDFTRCLFNADAVLQIGDIGVRAVAVPHDAREPVQYCFTHGGLRAGILTDLGSVTAHVCEAFSSCDLLILEFNHDRRMLLEGPYPEALKQRVGGDWGHLSNMQALQLLQSIDLSRLQTLVVAHTSEKNNSRECIETLLAEAMPELLPKTLWASQDGGFHRIHLGSRCFAAYAEASAGKHSGRPGPAGESDSGAERRAASTPLASAAPLGAY